MYLGQKLPKVVLITFYLNFSLKKKTFNLIFFKYFVISYLRLQLEQ